MPEIGTSGLMSGDGKRGGGNVASAPASILDSTCPLAWCAEHVRQLEGESPFDNLMEVKS
jgi:hypothetical protein